jgi:hypothetical protein
MSQGSGQPPPSFRALVVSEVHAVFDAANASAQRPATPVR